MKDFYINVIQRGNNLLIREFKDGKKVKRKVRYKPTLYVPVQKRQITNPFPDILSLRFPLIVSMRLNSSWRNMRIKKI